MEASFKKDVLRELRAGEGRILLHDEVEERPGHFEIVPLWESIEEADILTPRDVFELMKAEGYKVQLHSISIFLSWLFEQCFFDILHGVD